VSRPTFDRREGRALFGIDPAAYEMARPGHPQQVYAVLVERCGLDGAEVLEIGPGTGQATRRLLELGGRRLVAVEPDERLAAYLHEHLPSVQIIVSPLEEAELDAAAFDLAASASAFHWVDEPTGLAVVRNALRANGWWAMWWTLFGPGSGKDDFMQAIDHLFLDLERSPSSGREGGPPYGLDAEARLAALDAAGFIDARHDIVRWTTSWDTRGVRALYGTFSPIQRLEEERREALLDEVAVIAERDFGGDVKRTLLTSLYTARRP
jgi:SAM-dependent methyltransferase